MADLLIGGGVAAVGAGALAWVLRGRRLRRRSLDRLAEPFSEDVPADRPGPPMVLPRHRWVAPLAAAVVALAVRYLAGMGWPFALSFGFVALVLAWLAEVQVFHRRCLKFETQLVDGIDLVVSSLNAGAPTMDALETAGRETERPLRPLLLDLTGRIRLGDAPVEVLREFALQVPLETFRLFCFALSVHEEVGGSLSPTLSKVARTIRDRIELKRRVRAESTQAQASVIGVLLITYGIAFITWRMHPERMEAFLGSSVGGQLAAAAVALQAVGLFWMARLTNIRF